MREKLGEIHVVKQPLHTVAYKRSLVIYVMCSTASMHWCIKPQKPQRIPTFIYYLVVY